MSINARLAPVFQKSKKTARILRAINNRSRQKSFFTFKSIPAPVSGISIELLGLSNQSLLSTLPFLERKALSLRKEMDRTSAILSGKKSSSSLRQPQIFCLKRERVRERRPKTSNIPNTIGTSRSTRFQIPQV